MQTARIHAQAHLRPRYRQYRTYLSSISPELVIDRVLYAIALIGVLVTVRMGMP